MIRRQKDSTIINTNGMNKFKLSYIALNYTFISTNDRGQISNNNKTVFNWLKKVMASVQNKNLRLCTATFEKIYYHIATLINIDPPAFQPHPK